ncbi:MAG: tripartite tricarboxylate transporter substrate binding protein [Alphaproteobacteria bacterium]|nr:tripartite tricarboxylate transporter substrate binding protein [Alphaproteobacteria bacterium]
MPTRRQAIQGAFAALAVPQISASAFAQDGPYPSRSIRAVCSFPPGSGADITVRYIAARLEKICGQRVLVENKPGAFGNIASEFVARSKPDGYTIYIAPGFSVLAPAPHLFRKLNFDPLNDFEHVATIYKTQFLLCVDSNSPFKTIPQLVEFLKRQGDKASYASTANTGMISSEIFKAHHGLETVEVKYKTSAPAVNDLVSGSLAFGHFDFRGNAQAITSGRILPLMSSGAARMKAMPDVPSAREMGLKHTVDAWWSVHLPGKTPEPVVERIEGWIKAIVDDAAAMKFFTTTGADPLPGGRKLARELMVRDIAAWADFVKIAKLQPM